MNDPNRTRTSHSPKTPPALIRLYWVLEYRRLEERYSGSLSAYGIDAIPGWDGGERHGRRRPPIWPELAAYCDREQLDPLLVIRGFIAKHSCFGWPSPGMLLGSTAKSQYAKTQAENEEVLRARIHTHYGALQTRVNLAKRFDGLDHAAAISAALRRPTDVSTPLLWYGTVLKILGSEAADHFRDAAFRDYFFNHSTYDRVCAGLIPDQFRRDATALRSALRRSVTKKIPLESVFGFQADTATSSPISDPEPPPSEFGSPGDPLAPDDRKQESLRLCTLAEQIGLAANFTLYQHSMKHSDRILTSGEFLHGLWHSSDPAEAAAHWTKEWRITAVGNRPRDHMARDLMPEVSLQHTYTDFTKTLPP